MGRRKIPDAPALNCPDCGGTHFGSSCPYTVCKCGDYRHQHEGYSGPCVFNKPHMGHHGAPDCNKFVATSIKPNPRAEVK